MVTHALRMLGGMIHSRPMTASKATAPVVEIRDTGVDELREHSASLQKEHWDEIALHKEVMELNPNWHYYYELEERGTLVMLAAWLQRKTSEKLVGYSVSFQFMHHHYSGLMVMQNDVVFVTKRMRSAGVGKKLMAETMAIARESGCGMVLMHSKPGTAFDRLLEADGWGVQDIVRSKVI